jgi:hypothetical protein
MSSRNNAACVIPFQPVNNDHAQHAVLYNLKVIRGICGKRKKLENELKETVKNVQVFVNQIIVRRNPLDNGNFKTVHSTVSNDKNLKSVAFIPNLDDENITPHCLFLIGIENYIQKDNHHAIGAIVRDNTAYIFNSAYNQEYEIKNSNGEVISQKMTYEKTHKLLNELFGKKLGLKVYKGRDLQRPLRIEDYSIACTLFSEHFLLDPRLYTMLSDNGNIKNQKTFNSIRFTREQIVARTIQLSGIHMNHNKVNELIHHMKNVVLPAPMNVNVNKGVGIKRGRNNGPQNNIKKARINGLQNMNVGNNGNKMNVNRPKNGRQNMMNVNGNNIMNVNGHVNSRGAKNRTT